jgi:hypothetical protein
MRQRSDLLVGLTASILQRNGIPMGHIELHEQPHMGAAWAQAVTVTEAQAPQLQAQHMRAHCHLAHIGPVQAVYAVGAQDAALQAAEAAASQG